MNNQNLESFVISNPSDIPNNQEYLTTSNTNKSFSLIYKKKIADRVENLKSKKHFKEIFKIIYATSSNSYTKDNNGNGIYINFNLLPNESIKLIEDYLNNISPKIEHIPLPTKYKPYYSDEFTPKDSGIKLSNHEKNFLKYVGSENNYIESDSSLKTSDQNKTKIIIKPFTFE